MKVAIIGSGPLAIELALKLYKEEASVTLFSKGDLGGSVKTLAPYLGDYILGKSFLSITTEEGRKTLSYDLPDSEPRLATYWEKYLKPLTEKPEILNLVKSGEVLRIKKCFFSPNEDNRLRDLFRVFYSVNPKETILKSIEENPSVFENLGKEVLDSLNEKMEFFEDFDLVVDARGVLFNPLPMGSSQGEALNEEVLSKKGLVFYGINAFLNLEQVKNDAKTVLIVGSGETAASYLLLLKDWFFSHPDRKIVLVTKEKRPFEDGEINQNLKKFLEEINLEYEKRVEIFQADINKWKELEDFVKAKVPKPTEPIKKLEILVESTISSLDRLLDKNNLFVTVESNQEIRTIALDAILVATGYQIETSIFKGLHMDFDYGEKTAKNFIHAEPGIYSLGPIIKDKRYNLEDGLEQIPLILENMFTFFSKRM